MYDQFERSVIRPHTRTDYRATVKAPFAPEFYGTLQHKYPNRTKLRRTLSNQSNESAAYSLKSFFEQNYAPLFAAPVYIGIAVKQPIIRRIKQHIAIYEKYRDLPPCEREALRKQLLSKNTPEGILESEGHLFALELAARGIELKEMLLVTLPLTNTELPFAETIEEVLNRLAYPLFGRM